jgi:hypothetical protein
MKARFCSMKSQCLFEEGRAAEQRGVPWRSQGLSMSSWEVDPLGGMVLLCCKLTWNPQPMAFENLSYDFAGENDSLVGVRIHCRAVHHNVDSVVKVSHGFPMLRWKNSWGQKMTKDYLGEDACRKSFWHPINLRHTMLPVLSQARDRTSKT